MKFFVAVEIAVILVALWGIYKLARWAWIKATAEAPLEAVRDVNTIHEAVKGIDPKKVNKKKKAIEKKLDI